VSRLPCCPGAAVGVVELIAGFRILARLLSFRAHGLKPVQTADFEFLRVLGEGGFGKVSRLLARSRLQFESRLACFLVFCFSAT
jgi:hypothetical protein